MRLGLLCQCYYISKVLTQNRRIVLNVVATYGRSLYEVVCGLFTTRWVLMALGVTDFGLYGVVGGLTLFMTFFSSVLAHAVGRFYAFYVGAAKNNAEEGLEDCCKWFNTALLLHTVVPSVLLVIWYPIGVWAIEHFFVIPFDRVIPCVWVWRMVCISGFVTMVNVPFQAMYVAKQEIAELTVYSLATTTLNTMAFYYMSGHPGDWLVRYALWMCLMVVLPQILIGWRAVIRYPECRFYAHYLYDGHRIKEILMYAGSQLWSRATALGNLQGQAILVNKHLGPDSNATMSVGNGIAARTQVLSGALSGAFWPAITNAAGAGAYDKMRKFAFMTCRLEALMMLVFAIPLAIETHEILRLWLKMPPPLAAEFCILILIEIVLEKMTDGYWMSIFALGKVVRYSFVVGWADVIGFSISWGLLILGCGVLSAAIARVVIKLITVAVRLYFGWKIASLPAGHWFCGICVPIVFTTGVSAGVGLLPRIWMEPSLWRVCVSSVLCEIVFLLLAWYVILENRERNYVCARVVELGNRVRMINQ